jgi:hypothetical protein
MTKKEIEKMGFKPYLSDVNYYCDSLHMWMKHKELKELTLEEFLLKIKESWYKTGVSQGRQDIKRELRMLLDIED